jgi:hypothetical protein
VQVYALASSELLHKTLDLFLTREAAEAELREILNDEPAWADVLQRRAARTRRAGGVGELASLEQHLSQGHCEADHDPDKPQHDEAC